jgi:NADH:ubiquinone oxidoreductase subunit E
LPLGCPARRDSDRIHASGAEFHKRVPQGRYGRNVVEAADTLRARVVSAITAQPQRTVTVLSSLLAIEEELGYIPPQAIDEVATREGVTVNDVWAVASFYTNFRFTPPGNHIVEVCWGPTCHLMGAQSLLEQVQNALGMDGEGDTPDGNVTLKYNTCLGACAQAPVVATDHHLYGRATSAVVDRLLTKIKDGA